MLTCSLDGCPRPHYAQGYCNPHWRRWKRNGQPGAVAINTPIAYLAAGGVDVSD